jgi:chromosome segregation ATPase
MERCYIDLETKLQKQSGQLQQSAGDLHRQEQKLSSDLEQAVFEAESLRHDYDEVRQEIVNLKNSMTNIEGQIRIKQAALDECKGKFGVIDFMCEWAGEIVGLNGELRKLHYNWQGANIKASSLQPHLVQAQGRKKQADEVLQSTRMALNQTKQNIQAAEAEIKELKSSLSEIRTVKQECATQLLEINDAFSELEGMGSGSGRDSVVRRLRRESTDLGDLLTKARVLLEGNGLRLQSGEHVCAM